MRYVVMLLVAFGCIAPSVEASQARTGGAVAGAPPGTGACAVLTKDMVAPFSENKKVLDLIQPSEEPVGNGTACDWGGVRLQLFAIPR